VGIAEIIFGLCIAITGGGTLYYSMQDEEKDEKEEKPKRNKSISFLSFLHGIMHEQISVHKKVPGTFGYTDYYLEDPYLCAVSMYPNFLHIRLSHFKTEEEREIANYYIRRTNGEKKERMELHIAEFVKYQHEMKDFFHFFARGIMQLPQKETSFELFYDETKEPVEIVKTIKRLFPNETWLNDFSVKSMILQKEKEHLSLEAKYQVEEHLYQDVAQLLETYQNMGKEHKERYKSELSLVMKNMMAKLTQYVDEIERKKEQEFLRQQERMKQRWKDE